MADQTADEKAAAEKKVVDEKAAAEKKVADEKAVADKKAKDKAAAELEKKNGSIRVWNKSMSCPAPRCPAMIYNFVVRENVVDLNEPLSCPVCKKEVKPAMVEACTDELTAEESSRLLPKA